MESVSTNSQFQPQFEISPHNLGISNQVTIMAFGFDGQNLMTLGLSPSDNNQQLSLPQLSFKGERTLEEEAFKALEVLSPLPERRVYQVGAYSIKNASSELFSMVDVCYFTLCRTTECPTIINQAPAGMTAHWIKVSDLSSFPDEAQVRINAALVELRKRARFEEVVFSLLTKEFSLSDLQRAYEAVLERPIDVRNFRKKIESIDILNQSLEKPRGMAYRPPRLFTFSAEKFNARVKEDGEIRFY